MLSRNFFCLIGRCFGCYGNWSCTWLLFLLVSMPLSNIDIISGVLSDVNLGDVTVFTFVVDLLRMIHELLFLILITNKIRFSFSFRLIEDDAIIFHRFESFHKLTLINRCFCFCDMIEDSFFGYALLIFVSDMIDCFNDFVFYIQSMCLYVTRL